MNRRKQKGKTHRRRSSPRTAGVAAVMEAAWDGLRELLSSSGSNPENAFVPLTFEVGSENLESRIVRQSWLRRHPLLASVTQLLKEPASGSTWGLVVLADGEQAITRLSFGAPHSWAVIERCAVRLSPPELVQLREEVLSLGIDKAKSAPGEPEHDPYQQLTERVHEILCPRGQALAWHLREADLLGGEEHAAVLIEESAGNFTASLAPLASLRQDSRVLKTWPTMREDLGSGIAWVGVLFADGCSSSVALPLSRADEEEGHCPSAVIVVKRLDVGERSP